MITHPAFAVEPWALRETSLDLEVLAQTESVFALSNGHLGMRGNLDEGEPHALPGTYLNAFWELRPLPYAEAGYGYPEAGETVVNVTNGKIIRLLVDDSPFDIRYGELQSHERLLDLRAGTLRREALWRSPAGKLVRVVSERLVSFSQRSVAATLAEAIGWATVTGKMVSSDCEVVSEDGEHFAEVRVLPLPNEQLIAIVRDVTERRRAEEALRDSEARKCAILGSALDAILDLDNDGHVTELNPAAERMFGCPAERLSGRALADLVFPDDERERYRRQLAHYFATGEGPLLNNRIETIGVDAPRPTRLDGVEAREISVLEANGVREGEGKFRVDQIHKRNMFVHRDGKRLMISYWCEVCSIRTWSPGKCMCCQDETALDLKESFETVK